MAEFITNGILSGFLSNKGKYAFGDWSGALAALPTPIKPKPLSATEQLVLVEEIHQSFNSEMDVLLASTEELITPSPAVEKSNRLTALGFTSSKEVVNAQPEINRLKLAEFENQDLKANQKAALYFQSRYPNYKFITESAVKKICDKYGLVYGEASRYKGDIPEKNLVEIENFSIQDQDECYMKENRINYFHGPVSREIDFISIDEYNKIDVKNTTEAFAQYLVQLNVQKCPLEIAAPVKDFNTHGMSVNDFNLVVDNDPIVLNPVFFEGKKHYLIVTMWGPEASDELAINNKLN